MVTVQNGIATPIDEEADRFFGVERGTNGTAAAMRRELAAPGARWQTSDGRPALSLTLVAAGNVWRNPWSGQ